MLTQDETWELARRSLRIETRVPDHERNWRSRPFIDAGEDIAAHVLRSTTEWKAAQADFIRPPGG